METISTLHIQENASPEQLRELGKQIESWANAERQTPVDSLDGVLDIFVIGLEDLLAGEYPLPPYLALVRARTAQAECIRQLGLDPKKFQNDFRENRHLATRHGATDRVVSVYVRRSNPTAINEVLGRLADNLENNPAGKLVSECSTEIISP